MGSRSVVRSGLLLAVWLLGGTGCSDDPVAVPEVVRFITSKPDLSADHNRPWTYTIAVAAPGGAPVAVEVRRKPEWMAYDAGTRTLSGTAGWENIGAHLVSLSATDGVDAQDLVFTVTVNRGEIICASEFGDPAASEYILPYPAGKTHKLLQSYCPSNPAWGHHNWFAYDFDTATGDTIIASRAGTVTAVQEHNPNVGGVCGQGAENWVFVEHDDGTVMSYVHLDQGGALVVIGQRVAQGQPVGLSGNSGCSAGPHVHVALFRNRTNFDRQSTLPFNYSNADGPLDQRGGLSQSGLFTALGPAAAAGSPK